MRKVRYLTTLSAKENFYVKPDIDFFVLQEKFLGANPDRENFIKKHANDVIKAVKGTGIFPSVKMAQMIIESANSKGKSGQGITAVKANNYFGIKADKGWKGQKMSFNTPNDGKKVSEFRVYPSAIDSIKDHTEFLKKNSRYTKNGVFAAKTPEQQADALARAGYSEHPYPRYADGINAMIKAYNLKSLDGAQPVTTTNKNYKTAAIITCSVLLLGGLAYYKYNNRIRVSA